METSNVLISNNNEIKNSDIKEDEKNNDTNKTSKIQSILSVLKSLRISIGMDVSAAPVPGSLISPYSSLVYFYSTFANNFEILISANKYENQLERLINIYKYLNTVLLINNDVFSKPLIPIVGETQISQFQVDLDGIANNDNYYCVEHIQNNPPYTLSCIYNKKEGIKLYFNHGIKIIFMGTYFKVGFEGAECFIEFEQYNEIYTLQIPQLCSRYLRGFSEYVGVGKVTSNKSNYSIVANYIAKPLFGGKYNYCESNVIQNDNNKIIYKISGQWDSELKITNMNSNQTESFFKRPQHSYTKINSNGNVLDSDSSKVWSGVINAHESNNNKLKLKEKSRVEDEQNKIEYERKINNIDYKPIHFKRINNNNNNDSDGIHIKSWELINFK